jgi:protein-disulfide isomerase/uncharacterized membrane protein
MICAYDLIIIFRDTHINPQGSESFCNINESVNCDKVALHDEYSVVLGTPVAIWAFAGFVLAAILALVSAVRVRQRFGLGFLFLTGVLFLIVSAWLIYVMHVKIQAWCVVCLAIDVINVGLFGLALAAIRLGGISISRAIVDDFKGLFRSPLVLILLLAAACGSLGGGYLTGARLMEDIAAKRTDRESAPSKDTTEGPKLVYLSTSQPKDSPENQPPPLKPENPSPEITEQPQVVFASGTKQEGSLGEWPTPSKDTPVKEACDCHRQAAGGTVERPEVQQIQVGVDSDGLHWKGSPNPLMVIHEFTDFECPHCRKAHLMLNKLMSNYPGKLRVYHRHFPLDHNCNRMIPSPFHPRACELSRIAVCAAQQGRFWEMTDYLFHNAEEIRNSRRSADDIARSLELDMGKFQCCMGEADSLDTVLSDIEAALELELKGTPAYVINGTVYYGKIPDEALEALGQTGTQEQCGAHDAK